MDLNKMSRSLKAKNPKNLRKIRMVLMRMVNLMVRVAEQEITLKLIPRPLLVVSEVNLRGALA